MKDSLKNQYTGLDVGKFLCALLILVYHYFSEHGGLPGLFDEILSLYAVAVAFFMVISGFLLFNKLEYLDTKEERWSVVKKQVKRIYRIYLLWSIPYLIFTICNWNWSSISINFIFWQFQKWIFNSTFYTIWFMPMLANGMLLTFWLTEKFSKFYVNLLGIICYILGALSLTYKFIGIRIPGFIEFIKFSNLWLGGARGWIFFSFPLILVGRFMVRKKEKLKVKNMFYKACIFMVLLIIEALLLRNFSNEHTGIDITIMMVPTVFYILGFFISIKLPEKKYYIFIRNISTIIFMSQRIFLTIIPELVPKIGKIIFFNRYIGFGVIFFATIIFSILIIIESKRILVLKKLF